MSAVTTTSHSPTASSASADPCGCPEFLGADVSRRGFLRGLGIAGASFTVGSAVVSMGRSAAAADATGNVVVVLSLRGAADGLSLVVPHGDPVYYQSRPRIAVAADQLLVRDGFFGLHPALAALVPLWKAGKVAAVHATGLAVPNRSHFAAMELVEDAAPGSTQRVGWPAGLGMLVACGVSVALLAGETMTVYGAYLEKSGGGADRQMQRAQRGGPSAKAAADEVEIYTTATECDECVLVKGYLRDHGILYTEKRVEQDLDHMREFLARGGRDVPYIVVGGRSMTGYDPEQLRQLLGNRI